MSKPLTMHAPLEATLSRRSALMLAGGALLLSGCSRTDDYALTWEEEVILHDGRRLWVTVTRHMKRFRALYTTGFVTRDYPKDVEISFDAGPPFGKFHRRFKGHIDVWLVEIRGDKLYLGLSGGGDIKDPETVSLINTWVIQANGSEYALRDETELMDFSVCNVLPWGGEPSDYDRLSEARLEWEAKWKWWRDYTRDGATDYDNFVKRTPRRQVRAEREARKY